MPFPRILCCGLCVVVAPAYANYADDTGYNRLKAELGAAVPTGSGIGVSQIEAPQGADNAYMPEGGTGTFEGTDYWVGNVFTAKSGTSITSNHAALVAGHIYGDNTDPDRFRSSMCPNIVNVDCYNANTWDDEFLAPGGGAPASEIRAVQNHAWIYEATAATVTSTNNLLRRQDFSINRDNYVCSVGLNNGSTTVVPDLMAAAYNVISVGVTNGEHSRGTTTSDMDGPGRRKPEIVAPLDATSFSTAYVSSASAILREKANIINTANARKAKTLKAALLAGATKDEFPAWAKTAAHPLDSVFGAGELNVYNSYFILNGGEQAPNPAGDLSGRPFMAWDNLAVAAGGAADYRLNIPAGDYGVELSAFLVWHRTANVATFVPDTLVNYDLALLRDPAAGGAAVTIDSSTSTLYTIEHVWKKSLPAGNYRLRVSRSAMPAGTHDYSIAWRLSTAPLETRIAMSNSGGNFVFTFSGLLPGQPYKLQSSSDLVTWTDIENIMAAGTSATRALAKPVGGRLLYRLLPVPL